CGQVPFAGPLEVVIFNTLNTPPPALREDHPEIPAELEAICCKALSKKPEQRYASCRDLAQDLGNWLAGRPIASRMLAQPAPTLLDVSGSAGAAGLTAPTSPSLSPTVANEQPHAPFQLLATAEPAVPSTRWLGSGQWIFAAAAVAVVVATTGIIAF